MIIPTNDDPAGLVRTLAALVPMAMDGFVKEVILADPANQASTVDIAEETGAKIVEGTLKAACATARHCWLLILGPGKVLPAGWEEEAARHIADHGSKAATWGKSGLFSRPKLEDGLLLRADQDAVDALRGRPRRLG
ncbi:glycosyltransferase [Caulobacter segnis]|uniref:glycosyltransferase n=1 Tax=Caulobacter segnis TaxID=88688 RepID=UPI00240FD769|nr:glycosyltransferase [Caulobacter segnis]MDG2522471.1 glycosyltransferase [Caulobacter segnis]